MKDGTGKYLLKDKTILVTGGAGFIGSNLCEYFISHNKVICLDNLSTGYLKNMADFIDHPDFTFIEGDIRDMNVCRLAVENVDYVFHEAALGSVPRSINDPATTNDVNISGFLNMLIASRDAKVKRFIYAASSSTYGDSTALPKIEEQIGRPLSPYAVTKFVNELYAEVFARTYGMESIGLRYFNVFGKRQDPNGAYAAVIPLWAKKLINGERPVINGDGDYSRDFTYIENVIQANEKAAVLDSQTILSRAQQKGIDLLKGETISSVFNVACGGNITLNGLFHVLKDNFGEINPEILKLTPVYGPNRIGDIPHSQASIEKARNILGYNPEYNAEEGLKRTCKWYWDNL